MNNKIGVNGRILDDEDRMITIALWMAIYHGCPCE